MAEVMAEPRRCGEACDPKITEHLQAVAETAHGNGDMPSRSRTSARSARSCARRCPRTGPRCDATLANFSDASSTAKRLTTDREAELKQALDDLGQAAENMNRLSGRLDSLRASIQASATKVDAARVRSASW